MKNPESPEVAELLKRFYDSQTAECVIVFDANAVVQGWAKGSEELLGWEKQEAIGKPFSSIFTPEDLERQIDVQELNVAKADNFAEDDRWHVRKDGSRIWVTGTLSAVKGDDGSLLGYVKVMRDRTDMRVKIERQQAESEALRSELQKTQLFLHTIGHEVRNPLAPLFMAVQLLRNKELSPIAANALDVINRQIAVIKGLADDLMDIARSSHGGIALVLEKVNVQELLANVVADLMPTADGKGVTLRAILQETPTLIEGDRRRLTQVFLNLLGNSIKYTPSGGTVIVKAAEEVDEVVVRFEDSGIGIPSEILPRIFEFFTQDTTAKKVAPGGLGVGLGLVREIVEAHHGVVAARSAGVNRGSEFTVRLPLTQPQTPLAIPAFN